MTTTPGYPDPNDPSRRSPGDPAWTTPAAGPGGAQPSQAGPNHDPYPQPSPSPPYAPQPGYGQSPGYPAAAGRRIRPGTVTGAAVLAFVVGGLLVMVGVIALLAGGAILGVEGIGGRVVTTSVVLLVVGILYLWAAAWALSGRNGLLLTVVAGLAAIVQLVTMFQGSRTNGIAGLAISIIIIALMLAAPSREWFRSLGAPTF